MLIIAALLAAPTFSVDAQTLYRCVEKGKPTSYQNDPCPGTAKTTLARDYVPERNVPTYRPAVAPTRYRRQQPSGAQLRNLPRATSPSACEAAKQRREMVLGKNNQGGNVDVRRVLNDAVAKACN
ncbi:MAG TPA: hypothetical protein VK839_05280 [Erythrobacter sp.]|nr:hypothetical protein [Erythrobacter sp.]